MFRATSCSSSGGQIVLIQHLVSSQRMTIPDAVLIQFDLLMVSTTLLESCRGLRREERTTRCHWMLYCTYDMLNMFRAPLCPSSGALDYMCVIATYGVQCLVAGCRGSGAGKQGVRPGRGMLHDCSRATSLFLLCSCVAACWHTTA